jgi:hypothetical protein
LQNKGLQGEFYTRRFEGEAVSRKEDKGNGNEIRRSEAPSSPTPREAFMRKRINTLIWLVGLLATLMAVPSGPAEAISCASGTTCTQDLTNTNVTGVTIDIQVTVNNTGSNTVLTVAWISDNIQNTPLGIDQFGYAAAVLASTLPPGWSQANCSTNPAPCTMDGFGDLVSEIDNPGGTDLAFSFTLNSLVTDFGPNANGAEFAAHIRYDGGCSGFVSDGTAAQTPNSLCIPDEELPLPTPAAATVILLGLGMLGLGAGVRFRGR